MDLTSIATDITGAIATTAPVALAVLGVGVAFFVYKIAKKFIG